MATIHLFPRVIEAAFNKEIDYDTDTIKVMLVGVGYTYDSSHKYKSDLGANEITGTGYTAGGATIGSKTIAFDAGALRVAFNGGNSTWGPGASFTGVQYAVVYDDSPATDPTKPLIGIVDFGSAIGTDNGDFVISWDDVIPGIFTLRTTT